jgi:hypothetical protein
MSLPNDLLIFKKTFSAVLFKYSNGVDGNCQPTVTIIGLQRLGVEQWQGYLPDGAGSQ